MVLNTSYICCFHKNAMLASTTLETMAWLFFHKSFPWSFVAPEHIFPNSESSRVLNNIWLICTTKLWVVIIQETTFNSRIIAKPQNVFPNIPHELCVWIPFTHELQSFKNNSKIIAKTQNGASAKWCPICIFAIAPLIWKQPLGHAYNSCL